MNGVHFTLILITSMGLKLHIAEVRIERILPPVDDFLLFKGDTVKAVCKVTHQSGIKNVRWQLRVRNWNSLKNDTTTTIITTWNSNRTVVDSVLEILSVPEYPTFYYRCKVELNDGRDQKLLQYHFVREESIPKADISYSLVSNKKAGANRTVVGIYNSSVEFKCKVDFEKNSIIQNGFVTMELTANSRTVDEQKGRPYDEAKGIVLEYNRSNLEADDGGIFMCRSETKIGKRNFASTQYIRLTLPLLLTGLEKVELKSVPGEKVEMVCEIQAFPTPKWDFQYDNKDVKNMTNITVVQNRLEIENVKHHHAGLYTCIAMDENGDTKTQNFPLNIIDENGDPSRSDENGHTKTQNFSLNIIDENCDPSRSFKRPQHFLIPAYMTFFAFAWWFSE